MPWYVAYFLLCYFNGVEISLAALFASKPRKREKKFALFFKNQLTDRRKMKKIGRENLLNCSFMCVCEWMAPQIGAYPGRKFFNRSDQLTHWLTY